MPGGNDMNTEKRKTGKKKKHILRKIIVTLIILVILAAAGYYAWSSLKNQYTVTYDEYTASRGTISNSLSFSGSLQLVDSMEYTSETGNVNVRNVYVTAGDKVEKGDKLIRMSNGKTYTADFDGTVNTVNVGIGDDVEAGASLVQIADFSHMYVSFRIDEYDILKVQTGDRCTVTATATEQTFESSIDKINYISASTGNVAYYTATAYVDVTENVYPGMQVTVTVPQEEAKDVVVLKMDAISFDLRNQAFVYVQGEDGIMTPRTIEVGVSNGNYTEIISGLDEGETVYAVAETTTQDTGLASLFSGMFGGQRINNNRRNNNGNNNWPGGGNFGGGDFGGGNFGGGMMPGSNNGTGGAGSRPSDGSNGR